MNLKRIFKNLLYSSFFVERFFPQPTLARITQATADSEQKHTGQIRFVVEAGLHMSPLIRGQTARDRAHEVFSNLRIWDTEHNSGVLIYLLFADRGVEIIADRGINAKVEQVQWEIICHEMEKHFRTKEFEKGVLIGIQKISELLVRYFPKNTQSKNELLDNAIII